MRPSLVVLAAAMLARCAAAPPPEPGVAGPEGLQSLRYGIRAGAPEMEAIAAAFAVRPWPSPALRASLATAGLQAAVIRAADADAVRERLGPVSEVVRTEIGVATAWVDLVERQVPAGVATAAVPGWRPGAMDTAALALRGWIVPDATGGRVDAELAIHLLHQETRRTATPGTPPDGWLLRGATFACSLRQGEALLLLPRPPPPQGKGPAMGAELPAPCGMFLLGEADARRGQDGSRGFSTALVLVARLPPGITPPAEEAVDTPPPQWDTPAGAAP